MGDENREAEDLEIRNAWCLNSTPGELEVSAQMSEVTNNVLQEVSS